MNKMESSEYFVAAPRRKTIREYNASSLASPGLRCSAFLLDYILTLLLPSVTLVLAVYIKRRWMAPTAATAVVTILTCQLTSTLLTPSLMTTRTR